MICGGGYALVGIKMKRLHTFLSTAYLAALGTTVLIVYVMNPPVSDAIQGAYVVAIVCTGIALGGAAIVFPEITESLACLLGGFCLSMWLLTLQEGGLLVGLSAKIIFITCFSLAAFGLYFSAYTRTYGLIGCISWAGATSAVLGIDSFSRAGLKEFWVYIWALNDNLFPLGAVTYPLTRGIRVELAATVLIFLAGIVSQLKLWRIIQARRAKRDAEKAEGQEHIRRADEAAGRQVEQENARERGQWEAIYGDGEQPPPMSPNFSADSGVGDMESEKRVRHSHGRNSVAQSETVEPEPIEMSELSTSERGPAVPPKAKLAAEKVMVQDAADGIVTVRVAADDIPEVPVEVEKNEVPERKVWVVGSDGEARLSADHAKRAPRVKSPEPDVVPLPFKIPMVHEREDRRDDDRSSVATFADEDDLSVVVSRRSSLAKRLSQGSVGLLRSLSQRSRRSNAEKPQLNTQSREELVASRSSYRDDNESIGATIDGMSSDGEEDADTVRNGSRRGSIEIHARLADAESVATARPADDKRSSDASALAKSRKHRPVSTSETVSTDILGPSETVGSTAPKSTSDATELAPKSEATATERGGGRSGSGSDEDAKKAKSVASVDSVPVSITKDRLPRSLSRIAMSYRTNEWAKHLSNAETPAPELLQIEDPADYAAQPAEEDEDAAPVNVEELQQTAENGAPPPAAPRSASVMSNYAMPNPAPSRSDSRQSVTYQMATVPAQTAADAAAQARNSVISPGATSPYQNFSNSYRSASGPATRRPSGLFVQPIAEENDYDHQNELPASPSMPESSSSSGRNSVAPSPMPYDRSASSLSLGRPPVPGVVSYASPQTLIGKREMFLRNKSQGSLATSVNAAATPEPFALPTIPSQPASEVGSVLNFPAYGGGAGPVLDMDDLPMSQRKELIRQSSLGLPGSGTPPGSALGFYNRSAAPTPAPAGPADTLPFDSHQPKRGSYVPSPAAREAALASFRSSVAVDLRAGTPVQGGGGGGRETPLLGIDTQRSYLMGQKEAESQRREMERMEKERGDRAFEERMRRVDSGLMDAHRDAMRRMQAAAREK